MVDERGVTRPRAQESAHGKGSVCEFSDEAGRERLKGGHHVESKRFWKRTPPAPRSRFENQRGILGF
jgi:hypothetical protein